MPANASVHRRTRIQVLVLTATVCALGACCVESARAIDDPPDAISDVAFVDAMNGVLVGPRGQLYRTEDGGRRWSRLNAGVECDLTRIQFIDAKQGWIAGGWTHPYTHRSTGVLLRTSDGGRTWRPMPNTLLPKLLDVRFFNEQQGWAITEPSSMFPSGIAWTRDGGRRWATAPVSIEGGVRCAALISPESALVVSRRGEVIRVGLDGAQPVNLPPQAGRHALAATSDNGRLWLVGAAGMILRSDDEGRSWQDCSLPPQVGQQFDFSLVHSDGLQCHVAGSPGGFIFSSDDQGAHWRRWATGQTLPVTALRFEGPSLGWFASAAGGLWATGDGGAQWNELLMGGKRMIVLGVHQGAPRDGNAAWELFAQYCAEEGYFAAWETWSRKVQTGEQAAAESRWMEAANSLHAFPQRVIGHQPQELADAPGQWTARLVKSIRQWRPDVVVITADSPAIWADTVREAAAAASDPSAFPELAECGLEPWQVKRAAVTGDGDGAVIRLTTSRLAPALGQSVGQFAQRARQLTELDYTAPPGHVELTVAWNQIGVAPRSDNLLAGVIVAPGAPGRRGVEPTAELPGLQRRLQLRRNLEALFGRTGRHSPGVLLGQVDQLTRDLPPRDAGEVLFQLAMTYVQQGYAEFGAEVLERLVDRLPDHRLSEAAVVWLVHYQGSVEHQWLKQGLASTVRQASVQTPAAPSRQADSPVINGVQAAVFQQAAEEAPGALVPAGHASTERAAFRSWITRLSQQRPELLMDPRVRFSIAAADRREGRAEAALQTYQDIARHGEPTWAECARWELDLLQGPLSSRRPSYGCKFTEEKPRLDGLFNDAVWQKAEIIALSHQSGNDGPDATNVMFAYDEQYLYLAARSPKPTRETGRATSSQRRRDMDLSRRDHLELFLDLDRDHATRFELAIDHAGRTHDACGRDPSWDPTWYVASDQQEAYWAVEAAIAWKSLGPSPPKKGDVWLMGMIRRIAEGQEQAWTVSPEAAERGETFGALRFD